MTNYLFAPHWPGVAARLRSLEESFHGSTAQVDRSIGSYAAPDAMC